MPKISKRKKLFETILLKGCFDLVSGNSNKDFDEAILQCTEIFLITLKYCYSEPRNVRVPRSNDWYVNILPSYDDDRFKSCMRVTRQKFGQILNIVSDTTTFQSLSTSKSLSIEYQLAIALYRFGNDGSGTSFLRISEHFGISGAGMIHLCTERVITALLSVENKYITWPSELERKHICATMMNSLPGCIGYMDGTHIPLFEASLQDHEAYFSRKQQYALHIHAICDNHLLFRSVSVGYPASAHDARVFANSPIGLHPENYLSDGQWIAGDSAYRCNRYVVTPFRENSNVGTRRDRRRFNRHFSSILLITSLHKYVYDLEHYPIAHKTFYSGKRVKIEHAFGILKMLFRSLRSLRVRINKNKGHRRACQWIITCIVLYNIIKPKPQDYNFDVEQVFHHFEQELQYDETRGENNCQREILFQWFLRRNI